MVRNLLDNIKVLSANCRGLKDRKKRYDFLNYLKNTEADIRHTFNSIRLCRSKKQWDGDFILNCVANNARGVAIFFGNKFEYEILSNETDK